MNLPMNHAPDCARAWEAMPWVLQDSAPAAQKEWLMAHLAQCEACSAEFAQQARLRMALSLPADVALDVDAGLSKLLARLDNPVADSTRSHPRGGWLIKAMAAAVLIQALGIGVLGTRLLTDNPALYRTLSTTPPATAAGAIRVVPAAEMKLADWDKLLHALGLKVIDGPNEVGAYTVVPLDARNGSSHSLQQLRSAPGIRLAEPIDNTQ